MAKIFSKIKLYLEANGKTENEVGARPPSSVILSEDGIERWEVSGLAQPTEEQLNALESQANDAEALDEVYRKRKAEYPTIEECVHAILDDDLENLQIKRQAIKEKYPK
jgi:hypothetical protein